MQLTPLLFTLILILSLAIGLLLGYLGMQRRVNRLKEENIGLTTELDLQQRHAEEKLKTMEAAREQLGETFAALSSHALKHNTEQFFKLAEENFKHLQQRSHDLLQEKEKSVENLVKPIREALDKTEKQLHELEKHNRETHGSLSRHLESMAQTQQQLQSETRNLVQALRRPEVRGQWGEMTLKRLAELAGMVEHCDFVEQQHQATEAGAIRPDMIVRMPDGREVIVDAKTPLDAYLTAVEAQDEAGKQAALTRHARNVREHVKTLAGKAYWTQFKQAPDFVVMFIPGEQFLSSAMDADRQLMEDALTQKVIIATPTSFVALLRAVAYGWRQQQLAENAEQIRNVGEELYGRLATFAEHLQKVGRSLNSGVDHYNKAVASFDSRVLPSARKFSEMGISAKKEVEQVEQVDKIPRDLTPPEQD
ncbi:MAG: DNA recombination protein RmuC [Gammaproteobacteria bacterium]|nr:DNA recombination protein RmuC [Gammaproteobacteria bacterium]